MNINRRAFLIWKLLRTEQQINIYKLSTLMLHFATENFVLVARTIAPVSKVVSIYNIYIIENYSPHCVSLFMGFSYFVLFLLLIFHGIAELFAICLCIMFGGDWKWENIAIYLVLPESVLVFCLVPPPTTRSTDGAPTQSRGRKIWGGKNRWGTRNR